MLRQSLLLLILCLSQTAFAADLAREQRIADQIVDAILDGEPVWLEADGHRFLSIHTETDAQETRGGIILLHGMGANPDWQDVIQPLRTLLPEHAWETLSIQLPVAASEASSREYLPLIPQAYPRIRAAIDFFKQRQNTNLVMIGHSLGARMGLEFLATEKPQAVRAYIAIGLPTPARKEGNPVLEAIGKVSIPMLDLYGSRDLESVVATAKQRQIAANKAAHPNYRQSRITGADHFFHGMESLLQQRVSNWIRRVAAGMEIEGETAIPPASTP
ncbi:DUF3530 domain-containing protein [bacterium endosymbiont of Escarpia laminata]|nr:MAG: DUF3530 domain-containing protein [bacterium endosymbiont of Escarpia laminata]